MIRKLIVLALAVIGLAAILYFGWDWIQAGLDNLKNKATEYYDEIKEVPTKIGDITQDLKKLGPSASPSDPGPSASK
jgi:HAMP domain-containing protein